MTSTLREPRDPLVGTRIDGRYIIHDVLGRGGMGVVYDGVHEQLGRPVAIKVLGPRIAGDPIAVQRFLREARTASQLTHGNIVDVSDLGTLPDGRPYLVMAKLQGTDLCSLLEQQGPQAPRRTVELLRGAAAALDLVHAKGYVHRDVKPENLMHVVREDGSEAVLLLDFGIVGLISADQARLTAEGVVFGTPAYLAPEVIRGETPTPRSDIYSLATVAFELMTGSTPFSSPNVLQLLQLKLAGDAPAMRDVAGFAIDAPIEAVIATALSRDPSQRHPSCGAFIAALQAATEAHNLQPQLPPGGLDPDARERFARGSAELELSFGASAPPADPPSDGHVTVTTDSSTPPPPSAAVGAGRKRVVAAATAAVLGLLLYLALSRAPEPNDGTTSRGGPSQLPVDTSARPAPPPPAAARPAPAPSTVTPVIPKAKAAPEPEPAPKPKLTRTPAPKTAPRGAHAAPSNPASAREPSARQASPTPEPPKRVAAPSPSAQTLVNAAQDELVQGHLAAALRLYEQATHADNSHAAAFRGLGLVNERLGRSSAALRALRRAIALAPNDPKNVLLQEHIAKLEAAP